MSRGETSTQTTSRIFNGAVLTSMAILSLNVPDVVRGVDALRSTRERAHTLYSVKGSIESTLPHSYFAISDNPGVEQVILNSYEQLISSQRRASPHIEAIIFANLWDLYD